MVLVTMSSEVDEEDYSSIDERDPKMELLLVKNNAGVGVGGGGGGGGGGDATCSSCVDDSDSTGCSGGGPAYVNLHSPNGAGAEINGGSRRDKNRYPHIRYSSRKSRSRERPRCSAPIGSSSGEVNNGNNLSSPVNPASLSFIGPVDPDRIRERERELEKIHRRSRELMLSPRTSADHLAGGSNSNVNNNSCRHSDGGGGGGGGGWKPMLPPPPASAPPPLPPRIQSPGAVSSSSSSAFQQHGGSNTANNGSNGRGYNQRYKSPSPALGFPPHYNQPHHYHHPPPPPPPPPAPPHRLPMTNPNSLRRRVQSPNRRDFKDFSQHPRDFRSPMKQVVSRGSYFDDDDSGADSLSNNDNPCHHGGGGGGHHHHLHHGCGSCGGGGGGHCGHHGGGSRPSSNHGSSMALVPYGGGGGHMQCCSMAAAAASRHDWCCSRGGHSTALQTLPGVEERLLQLEGDKDSLHLQVALLSDQIEAQTEKICDLEKILDDKKDVLKKTEDILQNEMLTRSSLETKKLELMSEISGLKLRQAAVEKENTDLKRKLSSLQQVSGGGDSWNGGRSSSRGGTGGGLDMVMTLPPSGAKNYSSSSPSSPQYSSPAPTAQAVSNTLQTFGTMPRRSGGNGNDNGRLQQQQQQQIDRRNNNNNGLVVSVPLETHFAADDDDDNGRNWYARKLASAHGGSAPSLAVQQMAAAAGGHGGGGGGGFGGENSELTSTIPRAARHQSVDRERVIVMHYTVPSSSPPAITTTNAQQQQQVPIATKPKGLKKILGRMRRSNSGTIHEEERRRKEGSVTADERGTASSSSEQQQGHHRDRSLGLREGLRASAGSRFAAWIGPSGHPVSYPADPNLPFRQWKVETICSWLDNLGLYMYNSEVRKHVKIGEQFLAMSSHDLENKLGIKSSLHRKKVLLALQVKQEPMSAASSNADLPGRLDHQWVVRWLDDVGLPQYKDAFLEARVDGRVLNLITVEDLFQLRVTNLLHHLSIRRGIEVLRQNDFEPACLKRRASPDERERSSLPIEVALWTNHRVMEWLRHVDLAEYAPNLRGSGVHGALIIYEPRFNAELLASLLSIPGNKTLLRRHLAVHFRDLVGREVMKEKRDVEEEPNHQELTPTAKVKPQKRGGGGGVGVGQFSLRRRKFRPDEMDFEELVCPIEDGSAAATDQCA